MAGFLQFSTTTSQVMKSQMETKYVFLSFSVLKDFVMEFNRISENF